MHRISLLHSRRFKDRTKQHRSHLPVLGAMLFALLLTGVQFLPASFFTANALASTSPKPAMQKAKFTLDGVTVNVATPFLPGKFIAANPGDAMQTAVAETADPNVHPAGALYITAVPFGTKPTSEGGETNVLN